MFQQWLTVTTLITNGDKIRWSWCSNVAQYLSVKDLLYRVLMANSMEILNRHLYRNLCVKKNLWLIVITPASIKSKGGVGTVAYNYLQGPNRESPQAMRKLSDSLIAIHLGQRRYRSRNTFFFNQVQIVSHSGRGVSQEKYIFNHSTITVYTFRGFRSRNMHFIMSNCLVAAAPMHEFRSRSQVRYSDPANTWAGIGNILSFRGLFPSWSKSFCACFVFFFWLVVTKTIPFHAKDIALNHGIKLCNRLLCSTNLILLIISWSCSAINLVHRPFEEINFGILTIIINESA